MDNKSRKIVDILTSHYLFSSLEEKNIGKIVQSISTKNVKKNDIIFERGEEGKHIFALISGRVQISVLSEEGRKIILAVMHPGDFFGEIALLDGGERTADAAAAEDSVLFSISRTEIIPLIEENPAFSQKIIKVLCERLRLSNEVIEDSVFLTVPSRLAKALIRLAQIHGTEKKKGHIEIKLKISQNELASIVGSSREVINRHLRQFHTEDIISINKGCITINDINSLRNYTKTARDYI